MSVREFLIDTVAHVPPAGALEGLTAEEADRRVQGASHSISEVVAHMHFWAMWFCNRCEGMDAPVVASASAGWPAVAPGSWSDIHDRFLEVLERAASFGEDSRRLESPINPPIAFPPLANYTVRDALVHVATHNAHHLGQVIVLRQVMGLWPPPSGGWTW